MSDAIDDFRLLKKLRDAERRTYGVPCPVCLEKLPKAQPKIMLPGRTCRAHKPH